MTTTFSTTAQPQITRNAWNRQANAHSHRTPTAQPQMTRHAWNRKQYAEIHETHANTVR